MTKSPLLALLLSVLALGLAGYQFFTRDKPQPTAAAAPVASNLSVDERIRRLREDVAREASAHDETLLKQLDQRLKRLDLLLQTWTDAIQEAKRTTEKTATYNAGKIEEIDQQMTAASSSVQKQTQALEALVLRIKALEARPIASAAPAPAPGTPPAPTPGPAPEPSKPEMPNTPPEDPEVVKQKVDQALSDLDQQDPEKLYPAITVVERYKALQAVPKLAKLLWPEPHVEYFTRLAAAAALGEMRACDAVTVLAEALMDKSPIVAQQANKALRLITDFDTGLSPQARPIERRKARGDTLEWWARHEDEVRARWKQPKAPSPPPAGK